MAANVLKWGTGALNIDGCRVAGHNPSIYRRETARRTGNAPGSPGEYGATIKNRISPEAYKADHPGESLGRFPANLVLDEEAAAMLDEQSGTLKNRANKGPSETSKDDGAALFGRGMKRQSGSEYNYAVEGGASRFFYVAKASKSDRGEGNKHPTVKSTALMAYLCRLVTPPGGLVLDPFMGSGSTGVAALREGFRFVGVEQDAESVETAERRLEGVK